MNRAARLACLCAISALAWQAAPAFAAEQQYEGHLDADDPKLPEGQYYDELTFDAEAGQSIKFLITMQDVMPYAMLYSGDGKLIESTSGSYGGGQYALGTEWKVPEGGQWRLIVTTSYRAEVPYTLTWDVID